METTSQVETVTLTIDGKTVTVPKGTMVVDAAKTVDIEIPVFCYHEKLGPFGCCRMCLVEVEKMPKLTTARPFFAIKERNTGNSKYLSRFSLED